MSDEQATCAACGEPGRLHCSGCGQTFCVEHVERRFAMGYFYFCAACLAQQEQAAAPRRRRKREQDG
jgi:hypothetical protein